MSENMSVKAVEDYICEVARLAKSGITTEHTFRGALALLLDQLAPNLKAFNDPTPESFTRYEAMGLIPKTNPKSSPT